MADKVKKGYDSSFASDANYEDGFKESDKTRWERMRAQQGKGPFDFSRKMEPAQGMQQQAQAGHEGMAGESLEDMSADKAGISVPLDERLKDAGVSKEEFEGYTEENSGQIRMDLSGSMRGPKAGPRAPRFGGEIGKAMALENMSPEELAEIGLEPGTFAPIERDDPQL